MRAPTLGLTILALVLLPGGCKETPSEGAPGAASASAVAPTASAPAASSAPLASASAPASTPGPSASAAPKERTCEVEIFGEVKMPKTVPEKSRVVVYVAQDDCMADNAQILGHIVIAAPTGHFMIEVFPKWGSDITICAAVDLGGGKSEMYGKAKGKFHAEAEGEVTFNELKIEMTAGKPHTFPADRKP
jgi:hypothetical protein